jgi:Uma2 family endonuclease
MSDNPTHAIQYQAGEVVEENISYQDFFERYDGYPVIWKDGKAIAQSSFAPLDDSEGEIAEENISFEDFADRYEGMPVEWHMGKVIVKVTNNTEKHHLALAILQMILSIYLAFKRIGILFPEGYKMRLRDDSPARMPDLMIVLTEHSDRRKEKWLEGAADLVIEVVSPSTGRIDRGKKFYEYENGAVPEYWIVDPESQQVDVYHLNEKRKYQRIATENGVIISRVLKGFRLAAPILWEEELPDGDLLMKLIQEMLKNDA